MTADTTLETPTVEQRLAAVERRLAALLRDLYGHQAEQAEPEGEPAEPEPRTTAGADALAWLNRNYPAAPAAGQIEHEEHT